MWDTVDTSGSSHLSHDRPCLACGHAMHVYLPCSDSCDCRPAVAREGAAAAEAPQGRRTPAHA